MLAGSAWMGAAPVKLQYPSKAWAVTAGELLQFAVCHCQACFYQLPSPASAKKVEASKLLRFCRVRGESLMADAAARASGAWLPSCCPLPHGMPWPRCPSVSPRCASAQEFQAALSRLRGPSHRLGLPPSESMPQAPSVSQCQLGQMSQAQWQLGAAAPCTKIAASVVSVLRFDQQIKTLA